ncbi:serine hydrolase domain-containing protein [Flavitalea antarctica]
MKKFLRRLAIMLLSLIALISVFALVSGKTYLFRAVAYNFADIDDYKIFSNNTVSAGIPQPLAVSADLNKTPVPVTLDSLLRELETVSFLVIKDNQVIIERYWDGYNDSSWSNSFSMAKSITSLLIGTAIKDGLIGSVNDPVGKYLPEFNEGRRKELKIVDLLTMSSGSNWDESYANPLSVTTEIYYGSHANETAAGVDIIKTPGTEHNYKSGDTQLLAMIVEKVTGKSLSSYASDKLWKPLGAAHPALWSADKDGGNEKAYCCFNSNARDFARLGLLMLDSGRWNGNEIITRDYFEASVKPCMIPDEKGDPCNYYGYQWWIYPDEEKIFYARGILGQYIIVIPSRQVVMVRLGKKRSAKRVNTSFEEVEEMIKFAKQL